MVHASTVLIVDDDDLACEMLRKILQRRDYRLITAKTGADALLKAAKYHPDVILLDVMMPDMDGFEICQRLRADPVLSEVPILMITALTERVSRLRGIEAGADDFISKPVDPAELRARVRTITRRRRVEQALAESERRFRGFIEHSSDGIVITDEQGRITEWNRGAELVFGLRRAETIGRFLWDVQFEAAPELLRTPAAYEQLKAMLCDVLRAGESPWLNQLRENDIQLADGTCRTIQTLAFTIQTETGYRLGSINRDVTEKGRTERALRQYADQQAALYVVSAAVANLLEPDALLDAALDVVMSIFQCEAGWVKLPGATPDDLPRIPVWRHVPDAFLAHEEAAPLALCPVCRPLLEHRYLHAGLTAVVCGAHLSPDALAEMPWQHYVAVPLAAGEQVLGVMILVSQAPPVDVTSESDWDLLTTIGQQIGLALHNAYLYQTARQVDRLRVINQLDRALAATLDPNEVVEITLRQAADALQATRGLFFLSPPALQTSPHHVRLFTLHRGWIELETAGEAVQRLRDVEARLQHSSGEGLPMTDGSLLAFDSDGGADVTRQWEPPVRTTHTDGFVCPVRRENEMIGLLAVGGQPADRPFTEEDRALLLAAAGRAGQAIQNSLLYQTSQQRSAQLATLNAISAAAASSLDLDVVLRRIIEMTCEALDAESGSIMVIEPETGALTLVVGLSNEIERMRGYQLAVGEGIAGWVAQHGRSLRVDDVQQDDRWHDGVDVFSGVETTSLLCAPLTHRDLTSGVIEIVNKRSGTFTDDDVSLLESVSSIASAAMENARLYAEMRGRTNELSLLNEINHALTATLDSALVIQAAVSQIQRLFQAEVVSLLQTDSQTGDLYFSSMLIEGSPTKIQARLPLYGSIAGSVFRERQPVLIRDARGDPRILDWLARYLGDRVGSLMAAPLLLHGQANGVIAVISYEPGIYTQRELRLLQAIASTLAIALENASLYDELKEVVHEREQTQAQLIHVEKMTALGRLAASVAHEINNPLQAMQSYLTLSQEELVSEQIPRPERLRHYLDIVSSETERISAIVHRMRDFYRPTREQFSLIYLHSVLEDVLELTRKQLQHRAIALETSWAHCLPEIEANADHLKQVFLNLVLNGMDAMPDGGTLYISTALGQIADGSLPSTPAVRVDFSDTGEGMPLEVLSRIFEPFYTTKERGTGLGLSVSYGIIQAHRGRITVESHIGLGTSYTILLPLRQPRDAVEKHGF
jgi:two-component system NtrC family sensor kinase